MRLLGLAIATAAFIFGFRMIFLAVRMAASGKMLVREDTRSKWLPVPLGARAKWVPAPTPHEAWKYAFREGIMGLLLIILGVALMS